MKKISHRREVQRNIRGLRGDSTMRSLSGKWLMRSARHRYSYNFEWLGRPVFQYPQDLIALQEIVWRTKPEVIIETGVAHGGLTIFLASLQLLIGGAGKVVAIEKSMRAANLRAIQAHPLHRRIRLIHGSSIEPETIRAVDRICAKCKSVLVILDSDHTHDHVLAELRLYAPFVRKGNYLVVMDTAVEDAPKALFANRPWGPGNNPKTAVHAFMRESKRFKIDKEMEDKIQITVAPDGFLRCVANQRYANR